MILLPAAPTIPPVEDVVNVVLYTVGAFVAVVPPPGSGGRFVTVTPLTLWAAATGRRLGWRGSRQLLSEAVVVTEHGRQVWSRWTWGGGVGDAVEFDGDAVAGEDGRGAEDAATVPAASLALPGPPLWFCLGAASLVTEPLVGEAVRVCSSGRGT